MTTENVAVVITTYNRGVQLERCLWSVFENARVAPACACIVDDGSTDGTSDMLARLAEKYPLRWMWRERPDGWRSPVLPRNMALRLAMRQAPSAVVLTEPEMLWLPDTLDLLLTQYISHARKQSVNAAAQGFICNPFEGEAAQDWRDPARLWGANYVDRKTKETALRCLLMPALAVMVTRGYDEWFDGGVADAEGRMGGGWWGYDDIDFAHRLHHLGFGIVNTDEIRVLHQWHEAPPAVAGLADINLAHMQMNQRAGRHVVNDETWGTDRGRHPELAQ